MKNKTLYSLLNKIPVIGALASAIDVLLTGNVAPVADLPPHLSAIRDELFSSDDLNRFNTPEKASAAIRKLERMFASDDFARTDKYFKWLARSWAGSAYLQRYLLEDTDADLNQALQHWQTMIDSDHTSLVDRRASITFFNRGLLVRYERDGNLADLHEAVRNFRDVLEMRSEIEALEDIPSRSDYADLAIALVMLAEATHNADISDEAAAWAHKSQATPALTFDDDVDIDDDTAHADTLVIAAVLATCYELRKKPDDLALAIHLLEPIAVRTDLDSESHTSAEEYLGRCLRERYLREQAQPDLVRSTALTTSALQRTVGRGARLARRLNLVGQCLHTHYRHSRSAQDLEQAIDHLRHATETARQKSPYRARYERDLQSARMMLSTI